MQKNEKWFYRVKEQVNTYDTTDNFLQTNNHVKDFLDGELPILRKQSIHYFNLKGTDLPERLSFPFLSFSEKKPGQAYALYSATIYFVRWFDDDGYEESVIAGEDEEENSNGLDTEAIIWNEYGYGDPVKILSVPLG